MRVPRGAAARAARELYERLAAGLDSDASVSPEAPA